MSDLTDNLTTLLAPFGLSSDESIIYLYLLEKGFSSALIVSRENRIPRTRVYRILDKLITKNLVVQKLDDLGMKFGATDPAKFEQLVVAQEAAVESLKKTVPEVIERLSQIAGSRHQDTRVLYYTGVEGLKQITYNSLSAKGELLTYETTNDMSEFLPQSFSEEMRRRFVANKIHIRELTWKKKFDAYTNVSNVTKYWEPRSIDPAHLKIESEVLIYNDVYVMYNPIGDSIFGVEIYNRALADMQRQLFNMVWDQATKMRILNSHGAAIVEE